MCWQWVGSRKEAAFNSVFDQAQLLISIQTADGEEEGISSDECALWNIHELWSEFEKSLRVGGNMK